MKRIAAVIAMVGMLICTVMGQRVNLEKQLDALYNEALAQRVEMMAWITQIQMISTTSDEITYQQQLDIALMREELDRIESGHTQLDEVLELRGYAEQYGIMSIAGDLASFS